MTDYRRPAVPTDLVPAPAPAAFTPPAHAPFPVGGLLISVVSNLDTFEGVMWAWCFGQELTATDYPDLAERLGTGPSSYWGAAAVGKVKIPDLRDRFVLLNGPTFLIKGAGGEATHTLTVGEMPPHDHPPGGGEDYFWTNKATDSPVVASGANFQGRNNSRTTTGATGGGGAHNNMPPYITLTAFLRVLP